MNLASLNQENILVNSKPCVTIHLPTHQKTDTSFKTRDRIKLMRVLNKVEKSLLSKGLNKDVINNILKPAKDLIEDKSFWRFQKNSLVIFMAENYFEYHSLTIKTELCIIIDDNANYLRKITADIPFNIPTSVKSLQGSPARKSA